jgi:membrane protease YdiL (CAAX protease family)
MPDRKFNKKQVIRYLLWTFAVAYIIQFLSAPLYSLNRMAGQLVLAAMMFVPTLGVFLSGAGFSGMGWKPQIRKNIRVILAAWFGPLILTAAGALIYFLLFPRHFDLSGGYLKVLAGEDALEQMKAQGLSYPLYIIVNVISSITYAPLINMFAALGEEIGWRGFLYPQLEAGFGRRKGWLLGGFIWGAWHWPLIWLIGYEYGAAAGNPAGYAGFPLSGMLIFAVFAAGLGILHGWLYEKSGTIWVPSLLHGAFNGAAALPLTLCLANTGSFRLLGPAPNGLLSGLPILVIAAYVLLRGEKEKDPE